MSIQVRNRQYFSFQNFTRQCCNALPVEEEIFNWLILGISLRI